MPDMKQSFFTRVLNPIKDNKYFNAKDAMFVGTTAAGVAAGYGLSDGNTDHAVNGGIFGATAGLLHRQGGFKGFTAGINKVAGYGIVPESTKAGVIGIGGLLALGGLGGAISGWAGEKAGIGTTPTGGAIEGSALGTFVMAMATKTAHGGGGMTRQVGNAVVGKVLGVGGALAGGYEGFEGEDGGFGKAVLKGALWMKLGTSAGMLGMERYGKGISGKLAESKFGKMLGG